MLLIFCKYDVKQSFPHLICFMIVLTDGVNDLIKQRICVDKQQPYTMRVCFVCVSLEFKTNTEYALIWSLLVKTCYGWIKAQLPGQKRGLVEMTSSTAHLPLNLPQSSQGSYHVRRWQLSIIEIICYQTSNVDVMVHQWNSGNNHNPFIM